MKNFFNDYKKMFVSGAFDFFTGLFVTSIFYLVKTFYIGMFVVNGTVAFALAVNGVPFWFYLVSFYVYIAYVDTMYKNNTKYLFVTLFFSVVANMFGLFL